MAKGTNAGAAYFDGSDTGAVGKAERGGASGGAGAKAKLISGASRGAAAPKQAKGTPAGGTEELGGASRSVRTEPSGPSAPKLSDTAADVARHGGLSAKAGKEPK